MTVVEIIISVEIEDDDKSLEQLEDEIKATIGDMEEVVGKRNHGLHDTYWEYLN